MPCTRCVLGLVVIILLMGLAPVAYGDPPDPTWLGGYWDDADFDDVVVFICGICAIVAAPSADAGPVWIPAMAVEPADPTVRSALLSAASGPRSPPIIFEPYC